MSTRLASGGRLIDRSKAMEFTFNGKRMTGYAGGDTLAAALLGAGQTLVGRSFKYHRPRGIVASGSEEPNALVHLGEGARFEPDQRVTTTELFDGLTCTSQNHWPSLEFDVGAINNKFARFLTAGFYYKTFMFPRVAWRSSLNPSSASRRAWAACPRNATWTGMNTSMLMSTFWSWAAVWPVWPRRARRRRPVPRFCSLNRPPIGGVAAPSWMAVRWTGCRSKTGSTRP